MTSGSTLSYAFGALIASGVMGTMDKVFGFAGWRSALPHEHTDRLLTTEISDGCSYSRVA
jgi:hypothetical protein